MTILLAGMNDGIALHLVAHRFNIERVRCDQEDFTDWLCHPDIHTVVVNLAERKAAIVEAVKGMRASRVRTPVIGILDAAAHAADRDWIDDTHAELLAHGFNYVLERADRPSLVVGAVNTVRTSEAGLGSVWNLAVGECVLSFDSAMHIAHADDQRISLTVKEGQMLGELLRKIGKVATKESLLAALYGPRDDVPELKIIDVFICRLRYKLAKAHRDLEGLIKTSWARGYIIDKHPPATNVVRPVFKTASAA